MRYYKLSCLVAVAAVSWVSPAAAQQKGSSDEPQRSTSIDLTGEILHDSNIARSTPAQAALRGLSLADWLYSIGAAVDVARPIGRQSLFIRGTVGYDFHHHDTILNRERMDLHAGVDGVLGPCRPVATGGYGRHQSDLEDLQITVTRNVEELKSLSLDVSCPREVGLSPNLTVDQEWANNSNLARKSSDYKTLTETAGITYQQPTLGQFTIFGMHSHYDYPNQLAPVGIQLLPNANEIYSGGGKFSRNIGSKLQTVLSLSYTKLDPRSTVTPGFKGVTYSVDLIAKPIDRLNAHFTFDRSVKPSNRSDASYSVGTTYNGEIDYALGERIKLAAGGMIRHQTQVGLPSVGINTPQNETNKSYFGSADYRLRDNLSLTLRGQRVLRESVNPLFNYGSTQIGLTIGASF